MSRIDRDGAIIHAVSADTGWLEALRQTGAEEGLAVTITTQGLVAAQAAVEVARADVLVVEVDATKREDLVALQRLMAARGASTPVVVVTEAFDERVARWLLQIRVADFVLKSAGLGDTLRAAEEALAGPDLPKTETRITSFLGAAGGVGVTTLALQTAFLLATTKRGSEKPSVCIVDLDVQHGSCADYLDLEPRLDLGEIEGRHERLDRQLLEVMLSHHSSGIALIAAPNQPAEMRSFDPNLVAHLLDLVASHFDHVVIDMPRTWFPWTDDVLAGSDNLYVVTEMTVPGLRHAQRLVAAISERLTGSTKPKVIVNRFEERVMGVGLKRADVEAALGQSFIGTIPNEYRIVREAIDRGVPLQEVKEGNAVTADLKRIVLPQPAKAAAPKGMAAALPFFKLFAKGA